MEGGFPQDVYHRRRVRLKTALADAGIHKLLVSRLSNVRYLTGFTGSVGYCIVTSGDEEPMLLVDGRYAEQAAGQTEGVEVRGDYAPAKLWAGVCTTVTAVTEEGCAVEDEFLSARQYLDLHATNQPIECTHGVVERLRSVKDESELAALRAAGEMVDAVLEHLVGWLRPGLTERAIAIEFEHRARQLGAGGIINDPVIASGPRSALPHGRATERIVQVGEPVTLDLTPAIAGYRSDVTRTFHFGEPSARFREIYELVADAQRTAQDAVRPGVLASDVDSAARAVIEAGGHGDHFNHSVGHGVGLDIHELPFLSAASEPMILEPGMVVTVEPGVYVPGFGGVRLENSVVVAAPQAESLNHFTMELFCL